jgi:hypothetical protein
MLESGARDKSLRGRCARLQGSSSFCRCRSRRATACPIVSCIVGTECRAWMVPPRARSIVAAEVRAHAGELYPARHRRA